MENEILGVDKHNYVTLANIVRKLINDPYLVTRSIVIALIDSYRKVGIDLEHYSDKSHGLGKIITKYMEYETDITVVLKKLSEKEYYSTAIDNYIKANCKQHIKLILELSRFDIAVFMIDDMLDSELDLTAEIEIGLNAMNFCKCGHKYKNAILCLQKMFERNLIKICDGICKKICGLRDINLTKIVLDSKFIVPKNIIQILLEQYRCTYCIKYTSENEKTNMAEIIDMFMSCNYKITYDDIVKLAEFGFYINNFEKQNIKLDISFFDACLKSQYFPPYQMSNIKFSEEKFQKVFLDSPTLNFVKQIVKYQKPDIKCTQNACALKDNNVVIKFLILKQNIKPDIICLQNACMLKKNDAIIKFLILQNIKPDSQCVFNHAKMHNSTTTFIIDSMK